MTTGSLAGSTRRRPGSSDLKTSLIWRIAVVAAACFAVVTAAMFISTEREARQQAAATAEIVAKHLNWQLMRINVGFDLSNRYPDWDALLANQPASGQCVRLENEKGVTVRSNCVGTAANEAAAPRWFSLLYGLFLAPELQAMHPVSYKGKDYGNVIVSSDTRHVMAQAWREIRPLLVLTALIVLALSVLIYIAITRALAPTNELISGLNQLAAGAFDRRLPSFRVSELHRIGEVANTLAAKIEATLADRAELSRRLVNAQEEERRHLARELHDEFGQNLAAISALAASIEKSAAPKCPEVAAEARSLSQISARMMQVLRGTLVHLRPADLDKFGLTESLKQLVGVWGMSARHKTRFELDIPQEIAPLPDTAAVHIFRIAQEGLTNAAKHADAKTVRLRVEPIMSGHEPTAEPYAIRLTIEDDGKGRRPNGSGNAMGLLNMQERVAALGGDISFEDRPGSGLTVRVVVPIHATADQPGEPVS